MANNFLNIYVNKYKLSDLPEFIKDHVKKIEQDLEKMHLDAKDSGKFDEIVKAHQSEIVDLIERVQKHFSTWKVSWSTLLSSMKFVLNISNEVSQIVRNLYGELSQSYGKSNQLEFGKDLVLFVWFTIDPLKNKFTWIPFKKSMERFLVKKVAEIGLRSAFDLFEANDKVSPFSVSGTKQTGIVKCLSNI